jgi:membrane protein implicated in regulation of membrane protease activity
VRGEWHRFAVGSSVVIPLAYAVCVSSSLCYALLTFANKHVSSTLVTAFWPLQSAATIVLSALFLDASAAWSDLLGGALIGVGLIAVCGGKYVEERRAEQLALQQQQQQRLLNDDGVVIDDNDDDDAMSSVNKRL